MNGSGLTPDMAGLSALPILAVFAAALVIGITAWPTAPVRAQAVAGLSEAVLTPCRPAYRGLVPPGGNTVAAMLPLAANVVVHSGIYLICALIRFLQGNVDIKYNGARMVTIWCIYLMITADGED